MSIEAKQAREEAQVRETDRQLKDASIKAIEAQVQGQADAYKRLVTNSTNLAITADNITEIIKTFAKNLKVEDVYEKHAAEMNLMSEMFGESWSNFLSR